MLNKGISTPIAITIILILVILVGSFTWWQYGEIRKEETELPEIEIPEKEELLSEKEAFDIAKELYGDKTEKALFLNPDKNTDNEIVALICEEKSPSFPSNIVILDKVDIEYEAVYEIEGPQCQAAYSWGPQIKEVDQDGINEIVFGGGSGGTGAITTYVSLYSPKYKELFNLEITKIIHIAEPIPQFEYSDNLELEQYKVFRDFFEEREEEYPTEEKLAQKQDDPSLASYFWKIDNGYIKEGKIKIRWYEGEPHPHAHGSINDSLEEGEKVWQAYFKGGVTEYDKATDMFYVIYIPEDKYSWPTDLEKEGDFLYTATRGDGLIAYNLKTQTLKQFLKDKLIEEIKIVDDKLEAKEEISGQIHELYLNELTF